MPAGEAEQPAGPVELDRPDAEPGDHQQPAGPGQRDQRDADRSTTRAPAMEMKILRAIRPVGLARIRSRVVAQPPPAGPAARRSARHGHPRRWHRGRAAGHGHAASFGTPYPRFSAVRTATFGGPAPVAASIEDRSSTISTPSVGPARHCNRRLDVTGVSRRLNHPMPGGIHSTGQNRKSYMNPHILRGLSDPLPTTG